MNGTSEARHRPLRVALGVGLVALLSACGVMKVQLPPAGAAGAPGAAAPASGVKPVPPTEMSCGRDGNPDRCVVTVTVWQEGNTCRFSFAPDGLQLSRRLGQGRDSRATVRFVLNDVHRAGFVWAAPAARAIEFQVPAPGGRWVVDRAAANVFTLADSGPSVLVLRSTNLDRAGQPGPATYQYIMRVQRQGQVCESPDPWIDTGRE